ncbi:FHA domain-containing protein [Leptolyngbya ohadii]|uniref:FHA domain-containing protein n=1 Tax=Leptolyngbya ohadii TaxID=1962290 RepID=UPI000B598FE3|nr:FHA domain-containing protein [Leptolyngbya ohadii]
MIVCPNCNHQNPDAAIQCEACYTPLPAMTTCPNCGASVQTDASFCGQCGSSLEVNAAPATPSYIPPTIAPDLDIPDLPAPDPLIPPDPLVASVPPVASAHAPAINPATSNPAATEPIAPPPLPTPAQGSAASSSKTQLQLQTARLLHVQTNTMIELPANLTVIHIGKPNDRVPPDVDVSGFPNSEIVSRIHADIRVEGDIYYIEDVGSSNGTYINNTPLPQGNRHRLRPGDRVALGKGDKVSFLFQMS